MMSRAVESDEIGRIFSVLAIYSSIITSVIGASFQELYNKTLDTFPEAFLLVAAGVIAAAVPGFLVNFRAIKTFKSKEETVTNIKAISFTIKDDC